MVIEIKCGLAECMFAQHSDQERDKILKQHFADQISIKIMQSDYLNIKSTFQNNEDSKEGVIYAASFVILNEADSARFINQQKKK